MGKFDEITKARQILGLYELATLKDIKNRYKELLKEWHPDLCKENEEIRKEKTIEIINAFKTIMDYCENYKVSFSKEEIEKYISPDEFWKKRFGSDPIWGNYNNDEEQD
jgi:preprotein translocase subunit Sec63